MKNLRNFGYKEEEVESNFKEEVFMETHLSDKRGGKKQFMVNCLNHFKFLTSNRKGGLKCKT